jgi:hypothetical protein
LITYAAASTPVRYLLLGDRHPGWAVLAGDEGRHAGAVQVGVIDRAVALVGPVEVAAVHRYPERAVLAVTSVVTPPPFLVQQPLAFGVLAAFDGESFGFVSRAGGVLALVGVGAAAIEFEDPLRRCRESSGRV